MCLFSVAELALSWPDWRTTHDSLQWMHNGVVTGPVAMLQQPMIFPPAAPSQHEASRSVANVSPIVVCDETPAGSTVPARPSISVDVASSASNPPEGISTRHRSRLVFPEAKPSGQLAETKSVEPQPKRARVDRLVTVVRLYCERMEALDAFQGSFGAIQLLQNAGALSVPVIIVQRKEHTCSVIAGEEKLQNVYLYYHRAQSNQGHYNVYQYQKDRPYRYHIGKEDASVENFDVANLAHDAKRLANAKDKLVGVADRNLSNARNRSAKLKSSRQLAECREEASVARADAVRLDVGVLQVHEVDGNGQCLFLSLLVAFFPDGTTTVAGEVQF